MDTEHQAGLTLEVATAEFRAGVTAVLRAWSAFRQAVTSNWGGVQSIEKAELLRNHIYENFDYNKPKTGMDRYDLEDALAIYLEEEFCLQIEDDSEKDVAFLICQMYENCGKGDFALARERIEKSKEAILSSGKAVIKTEGEIDEESDDENMVDSNDTDQVISENSINTALDFAGEYLFGPPPGQAKVTTTGPVRQLGEAPPEKPKAEVDEDGFTTVPIRKR
jgi:pre-rRNA-processing protein TSR2